ncbi:MAG: hypothetical protein KAT37_04010 [Candidatus Aenigmarchaeota archaeon]|nr:hypothetical protein [Candidatus Aenigmarchaeota archaeon]
MILTRISKYIQDNGIKAYKYHTWRDLEDEDGNKKGELRVLVLDDGIAHAEYQCPNCKHETMIEQLWKRPFNVKCEKCGQLIRVSKLKDQVKKKK